MRAIRPFTIPPAHSLHAPLLIPLLASSCWLAACADGTAAKDGTASSESTHTEVIPGCEGVEGATVTVSVATDGGAPIASVTDEASLFDAAVAPALADCIPCHVSGGTADTDEGRALLFGKDRGGDRDALKAAWDALGRGVEDSELLTKVAGTVPGGHSGGTPWPPGSAAHEDLKLLLSCWADPGSCEGAIAKRPPAPRTPAPPPLLGDLEATGGRNYAAVYCAEKPDCATLPPDPRELIAGENLENPAYAVHYNDPFELCQTDALFENQARGNAILEQRGEPPAYTAKPRPTTCGEWRAAVEHGREYITSTAITGAVLTPTSLVNIVVKLGIQLPSDPTALSVVLEQFSQERYGWPRAPYPNPAPLPGEDPNATEGGSLQLPIALTQVKDDDGKWTGKIGSTCFSCHIGQIGHGEVGGTPTWEGHSELYGGATNGVFLGMNGSNADPALALFDTEEANGVTGPDAFNAVLSNPPYLANRTRGTNAADQEIVSVLLGRDFDTLDWSSPDMAPDRKGKYTPTPPRAGGDQDMPSWWWTHNKSRYLWVGFGSAGSSRGNFFPASTNPNDGHWSKRREGDFQDMDMWLNAVEAPAFVGPEVDRALAEQGAILFHQKDLWVYPENAGIPRPGGNGTCAGCHGAYAPRYVQRPGFLPDATLAGMVGYTVPLEIIGTDPEQSALFAGMNADRKSVTGISSLWMGYPDAIPGYRMPEERAPGEGPFPADAPRTYSDHLCGLGAKGGYTAQPLHGVWASGPYFHNGSVPTVWDVLSPPEERPVIWRRQRIPEGEAMPGTGYRGFDYSLDRAYDYEKLGWKYERLDCDSAANASYAMSCVPDHDVSGPPGANAVDERTIFNTTAYSKSNQGHAFTRVLTDAERRALVEYLKTL